MGRADRGWKVGLKSPSVFLPGSQVGGQGPLEQSCGCTSCPAQGRGPGGNSGWEGLAASRKLTVRYGRKASDRGWRLLRPIGEVSMRPFLAHYSLGTVATRRTPEASWALCPPSSGVFFWSSTAEPDGKAREGQFLHFGLLLSK